jgi:two-component system NtrC family sensor kinase
VTNESKLIESLTERVKELTCLYEIARISSDSGMELPEKIDAMLRTVPKAWKYHEAAVAEFQIESRSYSSKSLPSPSVWQVAPVVVDEKEIGEVRVHYPSNIYSSSDFLPEESQLLDKVALEVAAVLESYTRKEKEILLKRTAEKADRLSILGEITAGIAHELNTPLGNILGFSQFIQESNADPQVIRDAEKIENSANYAREVVKKLMFFSCEMPQEMQSLRINPLVAEAIELLKPKLINSGLTVEYLPDEQDPAIRVDPIQINQVIFNLILNAIHASSPGSKIAVEITSDDKFLCIRISDEGKGIAKNIQHRIFEPFFSTRTSGEGSGLGLSVVHGIVKSHKGKIEFESAKGQGTTFRIHLPLPKAPR